MKENLVIRHWEDQYNALYNDFRWAIKTACGSKIQYTSLSQALKQSLYMSRTHPANPRLMTPYLCPHCFCHHLGSVYIRQTYTDFIIFGKGTLPEVAFKIDSHPLIYTAKRIWDGHEEIFSPLIISALNTALDQELLEDPATWMYKLGRVVYPAEELALMCLRQNIPGTIGFLKIEPGIPVDISVLKKAE